MSTGRDKPDAPAHGRAGGPSDLRSRPGVQQRFEALASQLGQTLRRLRSEAKLTQEQAAERAGIHHTHLQRLEAGKVNPTLMTLMSLAEVYGTSVEGLFEKGKET